MQKSRLFTTLPEEYVCTPDGIDIDCNGDLILSCPNYSDDYMSGCVVRIDIQKTISKWFDVPVHPETGIVRNVGIGILLQMVWNIPMERKSIRTIFM